MERFNDRVLSNLKKRYGDFFLVVSCVLCDIIESIELWLFI